jgi:thiopurine S-methyltransferase
MDKGFWHNKWETGEIAFHLPEVNPALAANFKALNLDAAARVFVPLCGKTLDISWLLARGCHVVGAELSELAVQQLFERLRMEPDVSDHDWGRLYKGEGIDLFVGDIFDLSGETIGAVDAVYDRAALVALPAEMRARYTRHLVEITGVSKQLLITYEYDQSKMPGPPFSVSNEEVGRHYSQAYRLGHLSSTEVPGSLKRQVEAFENIWLLEPKPEGKRG